jgi:hypothetical protein
LAHKLASCEPVQDIARGSDQNGALALAFIDRRLRFCSAGHATREAISFFIGSSMKSKNAHVTGRAKSAI